MENVYEFDEEDPYRNWLCSFIEMLILILSGISIIALIGLITIAINSILTILIVIAISGIGYLILVDCSKPHTKQLVILLTSTTILATCFIFGIYTIATEKWALMFSLVAGFVIFAILYGARLCKWITIKSRKIWWWASEAVIGIIMWCIGDDHTNYYNGRGD